jgi:hypothetical protein
MPAPHHYKYPRTPHLPWSPGASSDDVWISTFDAFHGQEVIVTEKMDGENTTMYSDHIHARSLDSRHHPSRSWVKGLHQQIAHLIPAQWRVCGENLYARHSVGYDELSSYFMTFSIWDRDNRCLSWDETLEWTALLGLETVPVLWEGVWDEKAIRAIEVDTDTSEGYVVRIRDSFCYDDFASSIAKWVRENHVVTGDHWMFAEITPNTLAE